MSKENLQKIVVLGMGGTIAGVASDPQKPKEYKAGALGVADLIDCLGLSNAVQIDVQNVAQINSKYPIGKRFCQRSTQPTKTRKPAQWSSRTALTP